jgi:hypothetical protein
MKIQKYTGRAVKNGVTVRGYAAQGTECKKSFILVPAGEKSFHIVEVQEDSLVPLM